MEYGLLGSDNSCRLIRWSFAGSAQTPHNPFRVKWTSLIWLLYRDRPCSLLEVRHYYDDYKATCLAFCLLVCLSGVTGPKIKCLSALLTLEEPWLMLMQFGLTCWINGEGYSKSLIQPVCSNCINVRRMLIKGGNTRQVSLIYFMQEIG